MSNDSAPEKTVMHTTHRGKEECESEAKALPARGRENRGVVGRQAVVGGEIS